MREKITVRGARVHNLKNIDLEIPRDQLIVITGVSGSGKSSLAFDTLYAEGQRRYIESLSADTRQFLRQLDKPDVDSIEGLSPAIAVEQRSTGVGPRSTVGTITEIYDFLRLLFARVGTAACIDCGTEISPQSTEQIVDQLTALPSGSRIIISAPIRTTSKLDQNRLLREFSRQGFTRVKIDGSPREISEDLHLDKARDHDIELIIDRLTVRPGIEKRLGDSVELAGRVGQRLIKASVQVGGDGATDSELHFSQKFACPNCGRSIPELSPSLFSFNSIEGACPACGGLGMISDKLKTDDNHSDAAITCNACHGARLKKESLAVTLKQKNIAQVSALSMIGAVEFFQDLYLRPKQRVIAEKIVSEIIDRLRFLIQLGLEYLSLDRRSLSLSGGEAQRVRLATQLGSSLAGVLYILDEPSIGLHQRDNAQLLKLLKKLRDGGNSVIVVEHDPEAMLSADHIIDMGPGAGTKGGLVIAQGTAQELMRNEQSLTGKYLAGRKEISIPQQRRRGPGELLIIKGARRHNLCNLTVEIPIGLMTCITGVSGSGKSTLVMDVLYQELSKRLKNVRTSRASADLEELIGWDCFDRLIGIDQSAVGRNPRSNPATYTGVFDHIRDLFAQLPEARLRGYTAGRFSFNARGGRCEACSGDGVVRIDMYFLADVYATCDVCKRRRYNRETLEIQYKGLSIADVLDLTASQALDLFANIPSISERLRSLMNVGLGYLRLGQAAQTLSGGESQRLKLANELARKSTGHSLYFLDEPTSGLHFADVEQLLELLHRLTDAGNTLVVIEHNLEVIKNADYVIDLGPGAGPNGGRIVARGTPEEIALSPDSYTGQYLRPLLRNRSYPTNLAS